VAARIETPRRPLLPNSGFAVPRTKGCFCDESVTADEPVVLYSSRSAFSGSILTDLRAGT
jgi:hypothetical protein